MKLNPAVMHFPHDLLDKGRLLTHNPCRPVLQLVHAMPCVDPAAAWLQPCIHLTYFLHALPSPLPGLERGVGGGGDHQARSAETSHIHEATCHVCIREEDDAQSVPSSMLLSRLQRPEPQNRRSCLDRRVRSSRMSLPQTADQ